MNSSKKFAAGLVCLLSLIIIPVCSYADTYCEDSLTGTTYSIPSGWTEAEFNTPKEFLSAKYQKGNSLIMFGSMDLWETLDDATKNEYSSRDQLNNYALSDEDWETISGIGNDNDDLSIYKKSYANNEYIIMDLNTSYTIAGYTVDAVGHCAYIIKDGYMIGFQLQEVDGDDCSEDFEYVLCSASYPSDSKKSPYADRPTKDDESPAVTVAPAIASQAVIADTENSGNSVLVTISVIFGIIAGGVAIFFAAKSPAQKHNSTHDNISYPSVNGTASLKQNDIPSSATAVNNPAREITRKTVKCTRCGYIGSIDAGDSYTGYKCPRCFSRALMIYTDETTSALQESPSVSKLSVPSSQDLDGDVARFCSNCGKKITPGAKFCKYCGSELD